ncbi:MAG TPA: ISNCY family transposase [Vicinamibacterales bacterium]|jgi:transposase
MSARELARVEVLGRVKAGTLQVREAATLLDVSERQAKRLWQRFKTGGAAALRHRQVGRPSNRGRSDQQREQVLRLIREKYSGDVDRRFGPTLVAEHLASEDGLVVDHETVRRWMLAAGLWSRRRKRQPYRQRRARKRHFGELVQLDGSFHPWYEDRGPGRCLITMVDDATSRSDGRFSDEETIWAAAAVLRRWIEQYGIPRALYTDWKNVYVRPATEAERVAGEAPLTQFGRMCARLGIQIIPASSPQAKGRVERNHGTHQDRLVKKLRRLAISEDDTANAFLATTYWPAHNARFAQAPAAAADFHRRAPSARQLDQVFRLEHTRTVGDDWVVRYANRFFQLARQSRYAPARSQVTVCEGPDGQLAITYRGRVMPYTEIPGLPSAPPSTTAPRQRAPRVRPPAGRTPPAADHPWRGQYRELPTPKPIRQPQLTDFKGTFLSS